MRAGPVLVLALVLVPLRSGAQSEVGLILNVIFQGLQTAEAIRRSAENSSQFPNPPGQPPGDPIWDYQESSLVPLEVLRRGPYRNISGAMVLSARQTPEGQVELIFYRADGSVSRREIVLFDRRDGRRIDLDEKGNRSAEEMMESNTVWVISIKFLWLTSMSSSRSSLAGSTSNLTDLKENVSFFFATPASPINITSGSAIPMTSILN